MKNLINLTIILLLMVACNTKENSTTTSDLTGKYNIYRIGTGLESRTVDNKEILNPNVYIVITKKDSAYIYNKYRTHNDSLEYSFELDIRKDTIFANGNSFYLKEGTVLNFYNENQLVAKLKKNKINETLIINKTEENTYRNIILIVVVCSFLFAGIIYYMGHVQAIENKKNIYVLVNDKALIKAQASDITNSKDILTRGSVEHIHKLIYEQVPDIGQINKQLKEAVISSDKYTSNFIDALKQKQFFQIIISQNFFTLLHTDDIIIDYSVNPHKFNYKGTLNIFRQDQKSLRQIETEGYIQFTGRASENNERGFIVSQIKLLADKEIKSNY